MPDDASQLISDEQIIAYLDGELDVETERKIDHLLATNQDVRKRTNSLQHVWDALDELERPNVDESFTKATMTLITARANHSVDDHRASLRRRTGRWILAIGSVLTAGIVGFVCVKGLQSNPNRQLIRDLPVLENLDEYRSVQSIEFLRMLDRTQLFGSEETDED